MDYNGLKMILSQSADLVLIMSSFYKRKYEWNGRHLPQSNEN